MSDQPQKCLHKCDHSCSRYLRDENRSVYEIMEQFGREYAQNMVHEYINGIDHRLHTLETAMANHDCKLMLSSSHDIASMSGIIGMHSSSEHFKEIELTIQKNKGNTIGCMLGAARRIYVKERQKIIRLMQG